MDTKILAVGNLSTEEATYAQAVQLLESGEVVAFPTETVYGLGAVATNEKAVAKIFEAKGRPQDNPLIVHIGSNEEIHEFISDIPKIAQKCMDSFWPGPLTLILPLKPGILANNVSAGLNTVGVRMPNHPVALKLLRQLKHPVAAPSANRSGKPSPTKANHVLHDLNGRIPSIIDGGVTGMGLESTVLDCTSEIPTILRPGGVTKEMLEQVIGPVNEAKLTDRAEAPRAPGMKYAHYAPNAPVFLIDASLNSIRKAIESIHREQKKAALIATEQFELPEADYYFTLGSDGQTDEAAHLLYQALRSCDDTDADIVIVPVFPKTGVGAAIMNRLEKAANGKWYLEND
ncbi:threonylcarbamoyl-AMP synthase [Psychrobacillus sp. AK 1817]|uniref:L-threonylcarbamoyladenylate synthase n=1 Tax=Psychrobacillus sp. AK 1817 TaxID=2303505 RepID=UPI0012493933|nr:L-threonylcarbamoyladenylate synthase [Psychrobacillus sp. AK 1817]QEY20818.1 threonylcarbamoyl-AMP synthase [Psychrobacillus sp. AK 1817]